jgi:hypothetical protein
MVSPLGKCGTCSESPINNDVLARFSPISSWLEVSQFTNILTKEKHNTSL